MNSLAQSQVEVVRRNIYNISEIEQPEREVLELIFKAKRNHCDDMTKQFFINLVPDHYLDQEDIQAMIVEIEPNFLTILRNPSEKVMKKAIEKDPNMYVTISNPSANLKSFYDYTIRSIETKKLERQVSHYQIMSFVFFLIILAEAIAFWATHSP